MLADSFLDRGRGRGKLRRSGVGSLRRGGILYLDGVGVSVAVVGAATHSRCVWWEGLVGRCALDPRNVFCDRSGLVGDSL